MTEKTFAQRLWKLIDDAGGRPSSEIVREVLKEANIGLDDLRLEIALRELEWEQAQRWAAVSGEAIV